MEINTFGQEFYANLVKADKYFAIIWIAVLLVYVIVIVIRNRKTNIEKRQSKYSQAGNQVMAKRTKHWQENESDHNDGHVYTVQCAFYEYVVNGQTYTYRYTSTLSTIPPEQLMMWYDADPAKAEPFEAVAGKKSLSYIEIIRAGLIAIGLICIYCLVMTLVK